MSLQKSTSQLQGVLDLLEKKRNNPGDTDVETNFFNEALEYLLTSTVNHWWCTEATLPIARESLWLFSLPDHDPIVKYKKKLDTQLQTCTYCVQAYQTSKQYVRQRYDLLFPKQTVNEFFSLIDRFDIARVNSTFKSKESNFSMTNEIMCALLETIYAPHLLKDPKCDTLFGKIFVLIQQTGSFPTFGSETATHIIRMTLHHQRIVRFWSRKLIEKFITADEYTFSEQDFEQTKKLILGILKTFLKDSEDDSFVIKINNCPFDITQDVGELWKTFRLITGAASPQMLLSCLSESKISMPELIHIQLSSSAEWLGEILKTMTAMLLKMQSGFWGTITANNTSYYDIVKQICEHTVFQTTMKIAREGNTGKILQRDGSRYPDDKLMAKIKSMLEWIYPYWSSLRNSPVEKDITQKILDTTFGYFQMDTWGVMSRAYCAELGLQIIDQCLADDTVPVENMDEYITKIVGFAKIEASKLPALVQHMPTVARNILSDLVDRDSTCLNKAFNVIYQTFDLTEDIEDNFTNGDNADEPKKSPYESVWNSVRSCFDEQVKEYPWIAKLLFKAYSNIASADIPNLLLESQKGKEELSQECKNVLIRIADIRGAVGKTLRIMADASWEARKSILTDPEMTKPMLHLLCSSYQEIKEDSRKLIQQYPRELSDQDMFHDFFYLCRPLSVLEAFNSILREFIALNSSPKLDMFKSVPSLTHFLSLQVHILTSTPSGYLMTLTELGPGKAKDEDGMIGEFWDVCWRTISTVLDKSLQWASNYRPTAVASIIVPVLDTATAMMNSRSLFEKTISITSMTEDVSLSYDNINTMTDSLSHWIYVTRQDIISRLIPLTIKILDALKSVDLKISVESYDRLMTAATGVNASKLTKSEKDLLFMTLSAHEPTDFIFLKDDSDDEDVEWQSINTSKQQPTAMDSEPTDTTSTRAVPSPSDKYSAMSVSPSSSPIQKNKTSPITASSISNPVIASSTNSPKIPVRPRQTTLDQSFANATISGPPRPSKPGYKTPKITTYFAATATEPHEISDDDIEDEFGEMDYSQVPDEWFEVKMETPPPTSISPNNRATEKSKYFGDSEPMDIVEVPPNVNRINLTNTAVPPVTTPQTVTQPAKKQVPAKVRPDMTRVFLPQSKQPTFAVTSKGRKLRPPSMGFSKLKNLREEFRAERRLIATAKSPSAVGASRQQLGLESSGSSSDSSSDEGGDDSGLLGLIYDLDESENSHYKTANIQAESASVKALFETKPKRTIKLLETPIANGYIDKKFKARAREQHRRQKITPNIDRMFKTLFSWDITDNREIPPNTNESIFNHVPQTFASFDEYRTVFEPLLMLETWTQLLRSKEQLSQSDVMSNCLVAGRCHTNDFVDITFSMPMSIITNNLSQDDLVCIANHFGPSFFISDRTAWKGKSFLGKVMSINQKKNMGEVVVRCFFAADRISLLNSISPKTSWHILRIMSLTTAMREYAALGGLEFYDLGKDIIQPSLNPTPKPTPAQIAQYRERYDVNEPQAEAIVSAIQKKKGFSLIQGPPGTGKTKTILSLIVSLLDQRTSASAEQPYGTGKILVCAPSNAAVDEIAKRLKEGVLTSRGIRQPNIVRIGVADSVNASVKDRILDRLIEQEMDLSGGKNGAPGGKWGAKLDSLHQDIRDIQISLDDVDREITQSGSDMVQMSILRDKRKALGQKLTRSKILLKDTFQDQKNHGKEMEISRVRARQKVFANADVVCATLSGSGHDMLTTMGVSFETVIVDEAAQSIEISSLIPLKFDTQRCVLVGDPNQLPPTVISILAAKYNYQQSLFMRLEYTVAKEVNLLSIQYRMHPDISQFPSKLFYKSRLLDGPEMEKISLAVWHNLPEFPPYRFFNVLDGQEKIGRGKSIYNVAEADAAVSLVDMLCTKLPSVKFASKIGIITPYKQQVGQLKSKFQKRFGSNIVDVIDFNTVDGFQGQEKEIIIFSCVRAGPGRGIGFLADMRRMNVGLTRAKCSLFVLGNARSLYNSDYWGDLVDDARKRSLITDCEYPYFRHKINELSIPQNIFEKPTVVVKKKTIHYKRGPIKISEPHSNSNSDSESPQMKSSVKRTHPSADHFNNRSRKISNNSSSRDVEMEEPPSIKMKPAEDQPTSFLEKVRRSKELNAQPTQTPSTPSTNTSSKLSMAAYRASRGLPPLPAPSRTPPVSRPPVSGQNSTSSINTVNPPPRAANGPSMSNATSSLFINKRKAPVSRPKPVSVWPEGMGAKEMAVMEHSAAKERLKKIREEEKQRDRAPQPPAPVQRNFDSILDDVRQNERRDHSHERYEGRNNDRYDGRSNDRYERRSNDRYDNRNQNRYDSQRRGDYRRR